MERKTVFFGYNFSFSNSSGDFSGKIEVKEYKYDGPKPNELILRNKNQEYDLSTDIESFSAEAHQETRSEISMTKSLGKFALAGLAGSSIKDKNWGVGAMAAYGMTTFDTSKTVTDAWYNVLIQFKDGRLLLLPKVSSDEWLKLDEAFKVFTYEAFRIETDRLLSAVEQKREEIRNNINSLSGREKENAFQQMEEYRQMSEMIPIKHAEIRKIALEKKLVTNLTEKEQEVVDTQLEQVATAIVELSDYEFACHHGYAGLRKPKEGAELLFLCWITGLCYLPFEMWKRAQNKKLWSNIEQSEDGLAVFAKFKEETLQGQASDHDGQIQAPPALPTFGEQKVL